MKLSDKQQLLSYFKQQREKKLLVICDITGISFEVLSPEFPNIKGYCYTGLSPLASQVAAESLGECTYQEGHYNLSPSVLVGAILSLFHHYKLREDKLSAIEANLILSQVPLFELSQALRFLAALSDHEKRRIPHISLDAAEASTLKHWLMDSYRVLDVTNYGKEETTIKTPKIGRGIIDSSVLIEERKQARELLKILKEESIIPLKLSTIIHMSIQKNNLALIGEELRNNIINALTKLGTSDCLLLADIFVRTAKMKTQQESIVSKLLEEAPSIFQETSQAPSLKLSLAEIIAKKKEEAASKPKRAAAQFISEITELAAEVDAEILEDEEETIEEEFLTDHDTTEAIMEESQIEELNLEDSGFHITSETQERKAAGKEALEAFLDSNEEVI